MWVLLMWQNVLLTLMALRRLDAARAWTGGGNARVDAAGLGDKVASPIDKAEEMWLCGSC